MTTETPQAENEGAGGQSRAEGANLTAVLGAERYQKLRCWNPRLEVRYWTGQWWEPLTGEKLDAALDGLEQAPNAELRDAEPIGEASRSNDVLGTGD